jgi:hypothetical protein
MAAVRDSLARAIATATEQQTSIDKLLTAVSTMANKIRSLNTVKDTV